MKIPFFTGIITNKQMAGKVRLYRRLLGYPTGAFFVHNAKWATEPMEDHSNLRDRLREAAVACNEVNAKGQGGSFKLTPAAMRKRLEEIGPLLREAAQAVGGEDNLWGSSRPGSAELRKAG